MSEEEANRRLREISAELDELRGACNALYDAGYWTCDRDVNEAEMWENLREALKRSPGSAPKPIEECGT